MNQQIIIGPDITHPYCEFKTGDIYVINTTTGVDIVGTELTIDQLIAKVYYPYGENLIQVIAPYDYDRIVSSDGYVIATDQIYINPRLLPYGTVVRYYLDGVLVVKMYVKSVDRISKYVYKINTISGIGIMDTQKHYGNVYRGSTFENVVGEIIGGAVDFTVADDVKNLKVYGWLPYDTKRANLHQLLFSNGVMCGKDAHGDLIFRFISNKHPIPIPRNRIYYGGNVDYPAFASAVDVTEHSFFALTTDQMVTVYDNTDGSETANHTFIAFRDAPLHDLETTGTLVIEDSGVNWAIVTGTGILTGKKYTHSTRIMRRVADNAGDQRENVATVSDAYLVNVTNSDNVARRVLAYYNARKIVTASIVEQVEKCGDLITAYDPYDEPISGFISRMQSNVSGIVKAECEIITDYVPTGQGSNYTKSVILTNIGTWTVPNEVFEKDNPIIQVTLISGGHGGYKGNDGLPGSKGTSKNPGPATEGGEGGDPGPGGRVVTITVDCTGKTSFSFGCGKGGSSGQPGTNTWFGQHDTTDGVSFQTGVMDIFTGMIYGSPGTLKGEHGGKGSEYGKPGQDVVFDGQTWTPGERGNNTEYGNYWSTGGFGGGAAVGANGGNGGNSRTYHQSDGSTFAEGGRGGDGADATSVAGALIYGNGGNGGHGGGGAGGGGSGKGSGPSYVMMGDSGTPGKGGAGGRGGDGVIIIYY